MYGCEEESGVIGIEGKFGVCCVSVERVGGRWLLGRVRVVRLLREYILLVCGCGRILLDVFKFIFLINGIVIGIRSFFFL